MWLWVALALAGPARTRPPADPALAQALSETSWEQAEAAWRVALATELAALHSPPPAQGAFTEPLWEATWSVEQGPWRLGKARQRLEESYAQGAALHQAVDRHELVRRISQHIDRTAPRPQVLRHPRDADWLLARLTALRAWLWFLLVGPWLLALLVPLWLGRRLEERAPSDPQATPQTGRPQRLNPFVTGRPLREEALVYGRATLLDELEARVVRRQSCWLRGERRIGKTTLLLQLGERVRRLGGTPVFVDVAGTVGDQAGAVLDRALPGPLEALPRPLVLLIDEIDALDQADAATRERFHALCLTAQSEACLVGAGVGLRLWQDHLVVQDVPPLDTPAARRLLTEPALPVQWEHAALETVLTEAAGRPMLLQLYGQRALAGLDGDVVDQARLGEVRASVRAAWDAVQEAELGEGTVPVDLDAARLELGRLLGDIRELEQRLEAS